MRTLQKYGLWSIILSFFTCFCINSDYLLTEPLWADSGALLNIILFIGLSVLYYHAFFSIERRRLLVSSLFALVMGYMILLGMRYVRDTQTAVNLPSFFVALIAVSLIFSGFLNLLFMTVKRAGKNMRYLLAKAENLVYQRKIGYKTFLILLFVTGILYLITFLAVYPGVYSYDASVQVLQFFGDQPVTDHHPLLHTFFLCGSLKLGNLLFGSYQAGLALHSILQAAIIGTVFSYVIYRMMREKRPLLLVLLSYLFLVVNPYIRIFVFVTTKDVLFGAAFLLTFLFTLDLIRDREGFFKNPVIQIRFLIASLLMCFLRNQGIYVFLIFGLFYGIYLLKTKRNLLKRWLILFISVTGCYYIVTGPLYTLAGVQAGDGREMLSVPMQQLARAYEEVPERLTDEEMEYITTLIPPEYLEQYVSVNADPVKSGFQTDVMKEDPGKFIKTWFSIGRKAPLVYADSFFLGNWGYWYPEESQYWIDYIIFDGAFMEAEYNVLNIHRESRLPSYEGHLRNLALTPAFQDVPVLSVILNQAFPFWCLLITASALIYFKKYRALLPLILPFAYFLTLLLGPVTSVRYVLPLMFCVPELFCLILDSPHSQKEDE